MKILYICGTYAPGAFAGSELSAHQLMKQLNADPEIETLVATDQKYTDGKTIRSTYEGVMLQGIQHERRRSQIHEVISAFGPDVILTQLLWSDVAIELGESQGVPTVLRVPSKYDHQGIFKSNALFTNSRYLCDWIKNRYGRHCHYIFSTIDLHRVIVPPSQRTPRFITMFNPIRDKGGHIFKEIAKSMPDKQFAVVPGWHSLRTPDGSWDLKVIKHSLESQSVGGSSWVPEDINFEEVANVQVLEPTEEVAKIFAVTRLLLVPSQYEETLARVSIEAFANGIPVIGSQVGGLQEHIRKAGYLIEDYTNPDAWLSAIKLMEDETIYFQYSEKALQFIKNDFSNSRAKDDLKGLLIDVIDAYARKKTL
jgi:glycosyltransferase involved in cell wall biosynthesis